MASNGTRVFKFRENLQQSSWSIEDEKSRQYTRMDNGMLYDTV